MFSGLDLGGEETRALLVKRYVLAHHRAIVGPFEDAIPKLCDVIELARTLGETHAELSATYELGAAYRYTGRYKDAVRLHESLTERLRESGADELLAYLPLRPQPGVLVRRPVRGGHTARPGTSPTRRAVGTLGIQGTRQQQPLPSLLCDRHGFGGGRLRGRFGRAIREHAEGTFAGFHRKRARARAPRTRALDRSRRRLLARTRIEQGIAATPRGRADCRQLGMGTLRSGRSGWCVVTDSRRDSSIRRDQ